MRWLVGRWTLVWFGTGFPVGTLAVNITGSFAIGLAVGLLDGVGHTGRLFFVTGLLGGFTTFSAFSLDAMTMWQRGDTTQAALYVAASILLALAAAFAGLAASRLL